MSGKRFRFVDGVRIAGDNDSAVLLDIRSGKYYGLGPVALEICRDISAHLSFESIVDGVKERNRIPHPVAFADVGKFLGQLIQSGLCDAEE